MKRSCAEAMGFAASEGRTGKRAALHEEDMFRGKVKLRESATAGRFLEAGEQGLEAGNTCVEVDLGMAFALEEEERSMRCSYCAVVMPKTASSTSQLCKKCGCFVCDACRDRGVDHSNECQLLVNLGEGVSATVLLLARLMLQPQLSQSLLENLVTYDPGTQSDSADQFRVIAVNIVPELRKACPDFQTRVASSTLSAEEQAFQLLCRIALNGECVCATILLPSCAHHHHHCL